MILQQAKEERARIHINTELQSRLKRLHLLSFFF